MLSKLLPPCVAALLVFGFLFLAVEPAAAQGITFEEDFEDDTIGQEPTGFYTVQKSGNFNGDEVFEVRNDPVGTDQSLFLEWASDGGFARHSFIHDNVQVNEINFDIKCDDTDSVGFSTWLLFQNGGLATIKFDMSIRLDTGGTNCAIDLGGYDGGDNCATSGDHYIASASDYIHVNLDFDHGADTVTATFDGGSPYTTGPCDGTGFNIDRFMHETQSSSFTRTRRHFDNIIYGPESSAPSPPPGLHAVVTNAAIGAGPSDDAETELRWLLSESDPNQTVGEHEYLVFLDGVEIATDTITSADGDGIRFHLTVTTEGGDNIGEPRSFWIRARDVDSGLLSSNSCIVTVDTSVQGDQDSCGATVPGTGVIIPDPDDTAEGMAGFCSDLMGNSDGSLFLCGLIFVTVAFLGLGSAFGALANTGGFGATVAGSVGAFSVMLFNVFAQIWTLGAAVIIIMLATGVALALSRRLFFGGTDGDG